MAYMLPEKVQKIPAYQPAEGKFRIRLDANESPITPPAELKAKIMEAIGSTALNRYPDPWASGVCAAAAELYGVPKECIAAGNGSDELISILINGFCSKKSVVLVSEPDFDMYRFYSNTAEIRCIPLAKKDRRVDIDAIITEANKSCADIVIFSNPCNPTGLGIRAAEAERLVSSVSSLVVLDEAYMDFWDQSLLPKIGEYDNLLILKTCSKAFGLAALRLGFAIGSKPVIDALKKIKSPFNVNSMTQAAGEVILRESDYLSNCSMKIIESHKHLQNAAQELCAKHPDADFFETVTNFVLIRLKNAPNVHNELKNRGIMVRRIMGDFLRVTAGSPEENKEFLDALDDILSGG